MVFDELSSQKKQEPSSKIRKRVERVREIQRQRFEGCEIQYNSEMGAELIQKFCRLEKKDELFVSELYEKKNFSARAYSKILKVARTIADLEESEQIMHKHLCEAIGYRSLEEKYWNNII